MFPWSCRQLDTDTLRTFRLTGLHPGPDIDPYAVAAITGATMLQARRALDVLARAHLVQRAGAGRYDMHDLLRGYARELSAAEDTADEQQAALTRLFDHYLHTAAAAMDVLFPAEHHRRPRISRPSTPVPPLAGPAAAQAWLDSERAALVAATVYAAGRVWPSHAIRLAVTLASYLLNGDYFPEAVTVFGHALEAARRTGDRAAEATAVYHLGQVDWDLSRFHQATCPLPAGAGPVPCGR